MDAARPPSRRHRKRLQTAAQLSATAFRLFETHGYDNVSMEQIASEADVAKATLYAYFPQKEALIAHRFREDIAAGMAERAPALAAKKRFDTRMRYLLRESAAWHCERKLYLPHYIRFLMNHAPWIPEATERRGDYTGTVQILAHLFSAAQKSGEIDSKPPPLQIAWNFQYLLFGAVTGWLVDPIISLEDRFLAAFDLVMHGIAAAPGKA
jgi:AcrR family transcriptional regulator